MRLISPVWRGESFDDVGEPDTSPSPSLIGNSGNLHPTTTARNSSYFSVNPTMVSPALSRCRPPTPALTGPDLLQHGVKRTRIDPVQDTAAVLEQKQRKEQQKIDNYSTLVDRLYKAVSHPPPPPTSDCLSNIPLRKRAHG